MPRGFLVKRTKHSGAYSYRIRHPSDEDRSESGSDQEYVHTNFGSPDSGYSASPVTSSFRERYGLSEKDFIAIKSPTASPLHVQTVTYPSPLYYSTFDRLTVSNGSPLELTPDKLSESASTPSSPNKRRGTSENGDAKSKTPKKPKAARKINFDEDKSSPVSGTIIRDLSESELLQGKVVCGDIDSQYNFVDVTPEAKAEIERIENKIGDYVCQLCKEFYEDPFQLAQHRCARIVHIEYRCPECDKVFNCPANLASHRRWHKPRVTGQGKSSAPSKILPAGSGPSAQSDTDSQGEVTTASPLRAASQSDDGRFECEKCGKRFRRQAYLRKHLNTHDSEPTISCQYCSKGFSNEASCSKHEALHETGNKQLSCMTCNSDFPSKTSLEKHVRNHSNDTFSCKFCDSTFCSSPGLTRHINKCHPTENRQVILLQLPVNRPC